MTLRDIGRWLADTSEAVGQDLDALATASPLDWPLYIFLLGIPVSLLALAVVGALFAVPLHWWLDFWSEHFDREGNPLTRLGRAVERVWDTVFLICVFLLVWMVTGFLLLLVLNSGMELDPTTGAAMWIVLILPTIVALGFMFFMVLGRRAAAKELSERERTNSDNAVR
jgi:hypothetical protein